MSGTDPRFLISWSCWDGDTGWIAGEFDVLVGRLVCTGLT
jgi:hypothetical protein